jgi:hypothetical protein
MILVRLWRVGPKDIFEMGSIIWHSWTSLENSDIYGNLLMKEIFPAIASKNVSAIDRGTITK